MCCARSCAATGTPRHHRGVVLTVRTARPDDLPSVALVRALAWRSAYAGIVDADLLARLADPDRLDAWVAAASTDGATTFLVAVSESGVIGFSAFGPERDELAPSMPGRGEVYALYVHPERWRSGAGTALAHATFDELVERGYEAASLWALEANAPAIAFYERMGMRATGERVSSHLGELPEIRLARSLWRRPDVEHRRA
jgi:ribosomal protein S18 acetylase RimI-like enzyme